MVHPPCIIGSTAGGRDMKQGIGNGDGAGTAQRGILESGASQAVTPNYIWNY